MPRPIRVRRNIWTMGSDHPTITWYRKAVAEMQTRDPNDPTSWQFQANIHGLMGRIPSQWANYWARCQHSTWYFLPWHRGYITAFEGVVANTITDLGGPADWALPYWDYTEPTAVNPNARNLPTPFMNANMPDDSPNALFSRRRPQWSFPGTQLTGSAVSSAALGLPQYTGANQLGGPVTPWNHGGNFSFGELENSPHNPVHVQLGGNMINPNTAALDPIFWIHHCNVDRLWEKWRSMTTPARDPVDPQWRDQKFFMHDGNGTPFEFDCNDMLSTPDILHGFRYDNVPCAVPSLVTDDADVLEGIAMDDARLAAASDGGVVLDGAVTKTAIALPESEQSNLALEGVAAAPKRIMMQLENITSDETSDGYRVYIDLPDDEEDRIFVGYLSTFGLANASDPDEEHGGSGLTVSFDITDAAGRVGVSVGDSSKLHVTFEKEEGPKVSEEGQAALESMENVSDEPVASPINIGRINLFFQ